MHRISTSSKVPKDERVYAFPKLESQFTRFDIYRTSTYVHVVAANYNDTKIQVLNIDREKTVSDISLHFEKAREQRTDIEGALPGAIFNAAFGPVELQLVHDADIAWTPPESLGSQCRLVQPSY